jgi:hypothetical protein
VVIKLKGNEIGLMASFNSLAAELGIAKDATILPAP